MKRKWLAIGIILLFVGTYIIPVIAQNTEKSPSSRGNWLYVGGSGPGNYTRIQDAVDNATDGDTVFVYSGFYDETLIISVTITLQGEIPTTTIINGHGAQAVIKITTNNVKIKGFTITSPNIEWSERGVLIGANNTEIAYNIFQILSHGIIYEEPILIHGNNHSFHHNIFRNINYDGIYFWNLTNSRIYNNVFDNKSTNYGIVLYFSNYNRIFNNSLSNGLHIEDSYHNQVYNNTIDGKPIIYLENEKNKVIEDAGQVLLFTCENITIKNCYFNKSRITVHLCACKHCTIINNTFTQQVGCYLDYNSNTIIKGNVFTVNASGLIFWKCRNTVIAYNNFSHCYFAAFFEYGCFFNHVLHNNFINNTHDIIFYFGLFCQVRNNFWGEPRFLPKIIHAGLPELFPEYRERILIDWFPAQKPFDIRG